jgi:CheY-like chemotaxis protein
MQTDSSILRWSTQHGAWQPAGSSSAVSFARSLGDRPRSIGLAFFDLPPTGRSPFRLLQTGGYANLTKTTDPRQVLEFFGIYQPDLILLDLMMPHVDGLALMNQLRSRIPENTYLPIMVLTADVTAKAKQQALSHGAKDFLTKPFDATEVLLRAYNLLETRWLSLELQKHIHALENPSP